MQNLQMDELFFYNIQSSSVYGDFGLVLANYILAILNLTSLQYFGYIRFKAFLYLNITLV
jgi:hypothetical protein